MSPHDSSQTPPRPFAARHPTPPHGFDWNTAIAMRMTAAESDIVRLETLTGAHNITLGAHHARLEAGEKQFASIQSGIGEIKDTIKWTIKLIMGAVLLALLGTVLVKYGPTPSHGSSGASSSSSP